MPTHSIPLDWLTADDQTHTYSISGNKLKWLMANAPGLPQAATVNHAPADDWLDREWRRACFDLRPRAPWLVRRVRVAWKRYRKFVRRTWALVP